MLFCLDLTVKAALKGRVLQRKLADINALRAQVNDQKDLEVKAASY
jgi:hypothetical protein